MNNTFNISRFSKYLLFDLKSAWHNSGITILILGCTPVFIFAFYELFSLIFAQRFGYLNMGAVMAGYVVSFIVAFLAFPVRHYGGLTDKKEGSAWLMLPASGFEKFLSMLLISCVAVPAVWLATMAATDGLMSLVFHSRYGGMALPALVSGLNEILAEVNGETGVELFIGAKTGIWLSWCADILFFTLAAIFFRKNKIVYGFLVAWGIGVLFSILIGLYIGLKIGNGVQVESLDLTDFAHYMNLFIFLAYFIEFAVLDLAIYFRIKTLKH